MIGIYFSGTGNTKHCVEKLVKLVDGSAIALPLEGDAAVAAIAKTNTIFFGYCARNSNMPYFVREFITVHKELWKGKSIFCIATVGGRGGDGAGRGARLFKKFGAEVLGGMHIRMPESVCDYKEKKSDAGLSPEKLAAGLLKRESEQKKRRGRNRGLIESADRQIEEAAKEIRNGRYPSDGLGFFCRLFRGSAAGSGGSALTKGYTRRLKIDADLCDGCRICVQQCPLHNLVIKDGKAAPSGKCTACYRCINKCPKKAITLLGDKVSEQYRIEQYL